MVQRGAPARVRKRQRRPPTGLWRTVPPAPAAPFLNGERAARTQGAPSPEGADGDCDAPEPGSTRAVPSGMKADSPRQTHTPLPAGSQLPLGHRAGSVNTFRKRNCCLPSSLAAQGNPTKGGIRVSWVITWASAGSEATPPASTHSVLGMPAGLNLPTGRRGGSLTSELPGASAGP